MPARTQRGFNLIELMVVVTIAAIMLGIGVPSFREFTASQRVKNAAFDFAAALLLARSEAIKRNAEVTVARSGTDWASGWTVIAGTTTLSTRDASGISITPHDPAVTSVGFLGNGRTDATSTLRFEFADSRTSAVRCVSLSPSGMPSTTTTNCPT